MSPDNRVQAYAEAFYEATWGRYLAAFAGLVDRMVQDPALLTRIESSGDLAAQQHVLDGLLPAAVDPPVRNFLYALLQQGDLGALTEIESALRARLRQPGEEQTEVEVTSAVALTDAECQALQQQLAKQFGENLEIHYRVDPAILGGMIIRAGDRLIDGSVATRLAEMRRAMGVASES